MVPPLVPPGATQSRPLLSGKLIQSLGRLEEINEKENDDSEGGNRGERLKKEGEAAEGSDQAEKVAEGSTEKKAWLEEQADGIRNDESDRQGRDAECRMQASASLGNMLQFPLSEFIRIALSNSTYMQRKRVRIAKFRRQQRRARKQARHLHSGRDNRIKNGAPKTAKHPTRKPEVSLTTGKPEGEA